MNRAYLTIATGLVAAAWMLTSSGAGATRPTTAAEGTADFAISLVSVQSSVAVGKELRITIGAARLSGDALTNIDIKIRTDAATTFTSRAACAGGPTEFTCAERGPFGPAGGAYPQGFNENFYLTFSAPGEHTISATLVVLDATDPDLDNNSGTIVLTATPSTQVSASAVTVSPATPKAGSTVVASVRVSKGGSPVRPSGISCAATVGKLKLTGTSKGSDGMASCRFKTPRSAKGQVLRGTISLNAGGSKIVKRFRVSLR